MEKVNLFYLLKEISFWEKRKLITSNQKCGSVQKSVSKSKDHFRND